MRCMLSEILRHRQAARLSRGAASDRSHGRKAVELKQAVPGDAVAAKDSFAALRLVLCLMHPNHGLQPWLGSDAALRLKPTIIIDARLEVVAEVAVEAGPRSHQPRGQSG
jgi:hypothetical protein